MTSSDEQDLEQRVGNMERAIASVEESVDRLMREREADPRPQPSRHERVDPLISREPPPERASRALHVTRRTFPPHTDFTPPRWITARSVEWWLGGLGVVFLVIALFLLYRYAVDHNWITPIVRVLTGVVVGAGLVGAGLRLPAQKTDRRDDVVGLREIILGGGIAVWYMTSYAAAIFYQLISIQSARLCFLAISVAAAWLGLKERRQVLAIIAMGSGFAAPFLLPAQSHSLPGSSLYLGALAGVGVVLYLMRGWQLILWITFAGFWIDLLTASFSVRAVESSPMLTLIFIVAGGAFTRVPVLRRRLVASGSERYTPSTTPDAAAIWFITLSSPMLTIWFLSTAWPHMANEFWGLLAIGFAALAFRLSETRGDSDRDVHHVTLTAAVLWSLAGLLGVSFGIESRFALQAGPLPLAVVSLHAALAMMLAGGKGFTIPRRAALITAAVAVFVVLGQELSGFTPPNGHWDWTIAEVVVLGVAAWFCTLLRRSPDEELQGTAFGTGAYIAMLLMLSRVLGTIWNPLVTVSYAIAAAAVLLLARRGDDRKLLLTLGAATMVIVVGRLLVIDMSSVETIWRVLLFLACGFAFLYTSYRLQPARDGHRA